MNVRVLRQRMGLSVTDFAALLHVTRQTIHAWEKNPPPPSPALLLLQRMERDLDEAEQHHPALREIPAGAPSFCMAGGEE